MGQIFYSKFNFNVLLPNSPCCIYLSLKCLDLMRMYCNCWHFKVFFGNCLTFIVYLNNCLCDITFKERDNFGKGVCIVLESENLKLEVSYATQTRHQRCGCSEGGKSWKWINAGVTFRVRTFTPLERVREAFCKCHQFFGFSLHIPGLDH